MVPGAWSRIVKSAFERRCIFQLWEGRYALQSIGLTDDDAKLSRTAMLEALCCHLWPSDRSACTAMLKRCKAPGHSDDEFDVDSVPLLLVLLDLLNHIALANIWI